MGLYHSLTGKLNRSLFFSDFCKILKGSNGRSFAQKLGLNFPWCPTTASMDTLVHLWCVNCLSKAKWYCLLPRLRNRVMQDFIDTLYCTSNSFDEIFLLLFINVKSRYFILGQNKKLGLSCQDLRILAEDILMYAAISGLQYFHHKNKQKILENLIDFPLKTFSLCPCTRRPLYVAMYLSRPDVVRLLLNCGARIPYEDVCNCTEDPRHPLQNVMDVMKAPLAIINSENSSNLMTNHRERCVMSLRILLVDLCYTSGLRKQLCDVLEELTGDGYVTEQIPTLKHISRAQIRQYMKTNRSFFKEQVFQCLGLPEILVTYLNIEEKAIFSDKFTALV